MRFKNTRGSSLLAVIIFAFVVMVVISALAYTFNISSLSIKTQINETENINVHEGYFKNVIGSADLSADSDATIGQFRFLTQVNSITPGFNFENANITLYNSTPSIISYNLTHQFFDENVHRYSRNFIFNILPNITMTQYEETIIPLNLPYINTDAMSNTLKNYKLGFQDNKIAIYGGYIGFIEKPLFDSDPGSDVEVECNINGNGNGNGNNRSEGDEGGSCEAMHEHHILICHKPGEPSEKTMSLAGASWGAHKNHGDYRGPCHDNPSEKLIINAYDNDLDIGFPLVLSLSDYRLSIGWSLVGGEWIFHLAIYDFDRAYTSSTTLSNLRTNPSQARVDLSNWVEVQGLEFADGDIELVKWYYDSAQELPKLLILEKFLRDGNYELDAYNTIYDSSSKVYTAVTTDKYTVGSDDFDSSDIHISIPDALFTLSSGASLIFEHSNILDFNLKGNYLFGDGTDSTKATLAADVLDDPILVKKNTSQFYIIYSNNDHLYIYLYSQGVSAPTLVSSQDFPGEVIQKLIVKFGALFIVTDKKIYVEDISSRSLISSVSTSSGSSFQINRDGDGKIYAMEDGLQCSIDGNCNNALRIYLDTGCSAYTNGCQEMAKLDGIDSHLDVVYKSFEH